MRINLGVTACAGLFAAFMMLAGAIFGSGSKAYAIPAFARQLGVSCDQCHTIWPRLNAFGRKFKVKGYVDASKNPGFPLAARFQTSAEIDRTAPTAGPATTSSIVNFPAQVNIWYGGRLSPEFGVFSAFTLSPVTNAKGGTNWQFSVDEQKYAWNFLPGKAVSLVAFHSTIFGFDPFPSLGNLAFEGDYTLSPGIMNNGELLAPFDTSGFGLVVHGFLDKDDHFYGGAGVETPGAVPDTLGLGIGADDTSHDSLDYVARFAYTNAVGDNGGSFNIGGAYYAGGQIPTIQLPTTGALFGYHGYVDRAFLDGAVELPVGDNDLFEFIALYGTGSDRHYFAADPVAGVDGPFNAAINGLFLQTDYYWNMNIGLRATWDTSTLGGINSTNWQIGPVFLPVPDFKININAGVLSDGLGNHDTQYQLVLTKMF